MQPQDIRTIRQLTGLNQTEFAKLLGVALLTVNRWEKGHTQPKKKTLRESRV